MTATSTPPTIEPSAGPSTEAAAVAKAGQQIAVALGAIVLVCLGQGIQRPMIVSGRELYRKDDRSDPELRLNGSIFCEPEDHTTPAFRELATKQDPARIHGHPQRTFPVAYGEWLRRGSGIGEWMTRPTNLPAKG